MKTGERIYVELPHGGFEAELLAGYSTATGVWTNEPGQPIGCDGLLMVVDTDNDERLMLNGWMVIITELTPTC